MIVIPLTPMAAPRPRFSKFGTYNKAEYTNYKKAVLVYAKNQSKNIYNGAIKLEIVFYMPIPKSFSIKKKESLVGEFHVKKPDTDNLIKTIKDSLEGTFYKNDSQICYVVAKKVYDKKPRTEFKLSEI